MISGLIGTVIVYNPDKTVVQNIASYMHELDFLIIVDNSDSSSDFESLGYSDPRLIYIKNSGNAGVAAALNTAAGHALKLGYKWLLTMDQDSRFNPKVFSSYTQVLQQIYGSETVALIGPEVFPADEIEELQPDEIELENADLLITSGSFLNLNIWKKLGGFEEKLFIDEVDHDFCLKALRNNYRIQRTKGIHLSHNLGKSVFITKTAGVQRKVLHPPKRLYYIVRNGLYLLNKYSVEFPEVCSKRRKILRVTIKNNLTYGSARSLQVKFIIMGVWHYLKGKYGKYK